MVAPASCFERNANKVEHLYQEATFSFYICTPPPLTSTPQPDLQ